MAGAASQPCGRSGRDALGGDLCSSWRFLGGLGVRKAANRLVERLTRLVFVCPYVGFVVNFCLGGLKTLPNPSRLCYTIPHNGIKTRCGCANPSVWKTELLKR